MKSQVPADLSKSLNSKPSTRANRSNPKINPIAPCVMRVLIAVCVAPTGARLRRRGKPMNFVSDGVHRMLQLTQHGPPELRQQLLKNAEHSSGEDMRYAIDFRYRCEQQGLCSPAQGDPREGYLRPEPVSLPTPVPRRDIQLETRSVSCLTPQSSAFPSASPSSCSRTSSASVPGSCRSCSRSR